MLEIQDLHAGYGKISAVRGISLSVRPGSVTLVLGANGAGKTTTLRTVAGLHPPESGEVLLDGTKITGLPAHKAVRKGIVLVPEGRRVFADHRRVSEVDRTAFAFEAIDGLSHAGRDTVEVSRRRAGPVVLDQVGPGIGWTRRVWHGVVAGCPAGCAYAATKVMLTRELDTDLGGAIELEALVQALLMKSQDHGEFYRAWGENRKPVWRGR